MNLKQLEEGRAATLALVDDLDDEALCAQPDPAFSPIGWHLGHVAFTEAHWLLSRLGGDDSLVAPYARQWAQGGCPKHERRRQPPREQLFAYMAEVRARVLDRLPTLELTEEEPLLAEGFAVWFIESHEHQHRETITIVRQLALESRFSAPPPPPLLHGWRPGPRIALEGGLVSLGTDARLAYDNERPAHRIELAPFTIDLEPATVAAWEAFRADGGYAREALWSPEGWAWRSRNDVRWPRGWTCDAEGRLARVRLDGKLAPLEATEAVTGISAYEAEAFARWRGARLPTEAEWEYAACHLRGIGLAWEWTASVFAPYPGFEAFPYRGYSAPYFDGAHRVLRGGSSSTHPRIARRTFRNWYAPSTRQLSAGVRCVR